MSGSLSAIPPLMQYTFGADMTSQTEDEDDEDEAHEAALMRARRKKLRTRSEGSIARPTMLCSRLSLYRCPSIFRKDLQRFCNDRIDRWWWS